MRPDSRRKRFRVKLRRSFIQYPAGIVAVPSVMMATPVPDGLVHARPITLVAAGSAFLAVLLIALLILRASRQAGAEPPAKPDDWSVALQGISPSTSASVNRVDTLEALDGSAAISLSPALLASPEGVVIGSDAELCHIPLEDPSVSPRHVRFRSIRRHLWVEDLQSATGTSVDDTVAEPFMPQMAGPGQVLRIGSLSYSLSVSLDTNQHEQDDVKGVVRS